MKRSISIVAAVIVIATASSWGEEEMGFVNIINGAEKATRLLLDGKVIFESVPAGTMTGGMSLPVGQVKITAEIEGLKDDSSPVMIGAGQSQLVIVGVFKNKEDPPKDVLRVQSVPYKAGSTEGFSVGLIYAGKESQTAVTVGSRPLTLRRYDYVEVGPVTSAFKLRNDKGESYTVEFEEAIHYTLVVLDSVSAGKVRVLVVPNVAYQKPAF